MISALYKTIAHIIIFRRTFSIQLLWLAHHSIQGNLSTFVNFLSDIGITVRGVMGGQKQNHFAKVVFHTKT